MEPIKIRGLKQNNLKNVSLDIPKNKIIDVGPDGGTKGGEIVFTGTPKEMYEKADTITAKYLRKSIKK